MDPFLPGSTSPTIENILHSIDQHSTFEELCADLFADEPTPVPQPHADHDYATFVPDNDNEVIISDDIIIDVFDELSGETFELVQPNVVGEFSGDLVQENVVNSTNLEETLRDITEVLESDFSRCSSMSPSRTDSEAVSF